MNDRPYAPQPSPPAPPQSPAARNGQRPASAAANGHRGQLDDQVTRLEQRWAADPRWANVRRTYSAQDVVRLRGSITEEHTLARIGAERLWSLLHEDGYVNTLGALTGNQAVQQVRAGLRAIYLSGWQVAADANLAGQTYPDQSLYPVNSVPQVVRRINNALLRADQITWSEGGGQAGPGSRTGWPRSWPTRRRASAAC